VLVIPCIRVRNLRLFSVSSKSKEAGDTQPIINVVAFPPNELYGKTKIFKMGRKTLHYTCVFCRIWNMKIMIFTGQDE
jgi:hypothetical protein